MVGEVLLWRHGVAMPARRMPYGSRDFLNFYRPVCAIAGRQSLLLPSFNNLYYYRKSSHFRLRSGSDWWIKRLIRIRRYSLVAKRSKWGVKKGSKYMVDGSTCLAFVYISQSHHHLFSTPDALVANLEEKKLTLASVSLLKSSSTCYHFSWYFRIKSFHCPHFSLGRWPGDCLPLMNRLGFKKRHGSKAILPLRHLLSMCGWLVEKGLREQGLGKRLCPLCNAPTNGLVR